MILDRIDDCLHLPLADDSVDLVITSPPYEDARTYDIDFNLKGAQWVEWALPRYKECLRVCRGLVAWVVQGRTRQYRWSAVPALLMGELHKSGAHLRCPPIFHRVGIPGSGGPDWWRNDYEFVICATREGGKLPWSDNTATGHPCKYGPGGAPSHRLKDGTRITAKVQTRRKPDGKRKRDGLYVPPTLANPGNVVKCKVGGGLMGHDLAHETEAPFPESLIEPFVRCFCPPGGTVLDPMMGSGTTLAVALKWGRHALGFDCRESQVRLAIRRTANMRPPAPTRKDR